MKCKDCNKEGCPYRAYTDNAECLYTPCREIKEANNFDWQSFRNQAAKDILCQTINFEAISVGGKSRINEERAVKKAIAYADELIKQLKGKEEK